MVTLRPEQPHDLPSLVGGDSPFDDFGPRGQRRDVTPARLDGDGALVVVDDAGQIAGRVSWHWNQWGPTAASRCPMIGIC